MDEATREGLERADTSNQTVWWTWTPTEDGIATFTDAGNTYRYGRISIFNGTTLADLRLIANDEDSSVASLTLPVKAGLAYQICIGIDTSTVKGSSVLNIRNAPTTITAPSVLGLPAKENDNFADAATLAGSTVTGFTYNAEATREGLEPSYTGNQTLWWIWTAPADAQVTMNTSGSTVRYNVLCAFNGSALANLNVVASNETSDVSRITFPSKAGTKYYISTGVDTGSVTGTVVLNISTAPLTITSPVIIESLAAANDNFSNAQSLGSDLIVTGFGYNSGATFENLESSADGNKTLWWNWTASQDGNLTVGTTGTDFGHYLNISTGPSIAALTSGSTGRANAGGNAGGTVPVTAGTLYHFVIGSNGNGVGTAVLTLNLAPGLSHVSIAADQGTTSQSQASVLTFTLSRDGDLSKLVTVNYAETIKVDGVVHSYTGTKKLKAGKASAKLKVTTGGSYGKAVVKFVVKSGDGYVLGTDTKAKSTVIGD